MAAESGRGGVRNRVARARGREERLRRTLAWAGAGVVLLALAVGGGVLIGQYLSRTPPAAPDIATASGDPEPVQAPADAAPEQPEIADAPAEAPAAPGPTAEDSARARAAFEAALLRLEDAMGAGFFESPPADEEPTARRSRIRLAREKALEARGAGDFDAALRLVLAAEQDARAEAAEAEARYRRGLQAAKDAYAAGGAAEARGHIARALEQRPGDPEAIAWSARIARLPALLEARRAAADARAAGDPDGERAALRDVLALEPGDNTARRRAGAVDALLRERAFRQAIVDGRRAVAGKQPEAAREALDKARGVKPRHADTARLQADIAALERVLARDRHLAVAERAGAVDNWRAALAAFEQARALDPDDDRAVGGSELAARVVAGQQAIDGFLARPDRLSTPEVAGEARAALRDTASLAAISPRLRAGGAALERAIEAGQTPVPVRVLSDDLTDIGIRGVGRIGRTAERIVELRPGAYVFEGRRAGYRTKLVEVTVPANGDTPTEVRIVCDEKS